MVKLLIRREKKKKVTGKWEKTKRRDHEKVHAGINYLKKRHWNAC